MGTVHRKAWGQGGESGGDGEREAWCLLPETWQGILWATYSPLKLGYRGSSGFTGVLWVQGGAHQVDEGRIRLRLALTPWEVHVGARPLWSKFS